jgi:hypothetical protein
MKYESVGNSVLLREAIPGAASRKVPAAPVVRGDLWRRAGVWWERTLRLRLRQPRRLRLCESLPLGERRFVAVVEFERSRFLLGGTSASLVLLARLGKVGEAGQGEVQDEDDAQLADRSAGIFRESLD